MIKIILNNLTIIIISLAVITAGAILMNVSQKVYDTPKHVKNLDQNKLSIEWEIRALKAELSYLTRSDRLEQLSKAISQSSPKKTKETSSVILSSSSLSFSEIHSVRPQRKPISQVRYTPPTSKTPPKTTPSPQLEFSSLLNSIGDKE